MPSNSSEQDSVPRRNLRRALRWTIGIAVGLVVIRWLAPSEPDYGPPGLASTGTPVAQQAETGDLLAGVSIVNAQVQLTNRGSV